MATAISLSTVKSQLSSFAEHSNECARIMKEINNDYIEGTKAEWNTPAAAGFIESVCMAFNDFIGQFNNKYSSEMDSFVAGVNVLADSQEATRVDKPELAKIETLSKGWEGQKEDFNMPDDYSAFTEDHLTSKVNSFVSELGSMQGCIDAAVENGLKEGYCTALRESLRKLKESAVSVAEQYNGNAAAKAVDEDQTIRAMKENT